MGFAAGLASFRRFAVIGNAATTPSEDLLKALSEHVLRPTEIGVPEETEYGWCGGRHILDSDFTFEENVYSETVSFALRIDTNKVPTDLKKAYIAIEEQAAAAHNPSGFVSKNQKRDARDAARRKMEDDLRSGQFRRSKMVPILWDLSSQTLMSPASGKQWEVLAEIFERTFGLSLEPISAGSLALRLLEPTGRRRDYEDARPTRFVPGPEGEGSEPEYPWVAKGPEPKDFLGNEFALWLWHETETRHGSVGSGRNEFTVMIDRFLDLDCAYGQTGRCVLRATGPGRMPEAREAIRTGKLPRRMTLTLEAWGISYDLSYSAESMAMSAVKLPDVQDAESPRQVFEQRISMLRDLSRAVETMFDTYVKLRASSAWEGHASTIRRWIGKSARNQPSVAALA